MIKNDPITELSRWFASQCNEDWEHGFGIRIVTLDNPGWLVQVDLSGTDIEGCEPQRKQHNVIDGPWIDVSVSMNKFEATCSPFLLSEVIAEFISVTKTKRLIEVT